MKKIKKMKKIKEIDFRPFSYGIKKMTIKKKKKIKPFDKWLSL